MKPFNLEAFKAGQKALTRDGQVATFVGICEHCNDRGKVVFHVAGRQGVVSAPYSGAHHEDWGDNLVSMVSRHQALIDAYDPEDTWQVHTKQSDTWVTIKEPTWDEDYEWRLHPHNDLIKAYKKGAKIECKHKGEEWRDASSDDIRSWYEDAEYRIKPEQKTKTVYEWLFKIEADRYQLHPYLMDEEEAKVNFGKYTHKKTGRSWEVEV